MHTSVRACVCKLENRKSSVYVIIRVVKGYARVQAGSSLLFARPKECRALQVRSFIALDPTNGVVADAAAAAAAATDFSSAD